MKRKDASGSRYSPGTNSGALVADDHARARLREHRFDHAREFLRKLPAIIDDEQRGTPAETRRQRIDARVGLRRDRFGQMRGRRARAEIDSQCTRSSNNAATRGADSRASRVLPMPRARQRDEPFLRDAHGQFGECGVAANERQMRQRIGIEGDAARRLHRPMLRGLHSGEGSGGRIVEFVAYFDPFRGEPVTAPRHRFDQIAVVAEHAPQLRDQRLHAVVGDRRRRALLQVADRNDAPARIDEREQHVHRTVADGAPLPRRAKACATRAAV